MQQGSVASRVTRIETIVTDLLSKQNLAPAGTAQDLREAGLSSLNFVTLMLAVEAEFDIFVPKDQMKPTAFRSIEVIDALVASLT